MLQTSQSLPRSWPQPHPAPSPRAPLWCRACRCLLPSAASKPFANTRVLEYTGVARSLLSSHAQRCSIGERSGLGRPFETQNIFQPSQSCSIDGSLLLGEDLFGEVTRCLVNVTPRILPKRASALFPSAKFDIGTASDASPACKTEARCPVGGRGALCRRPQ
jgi:hypothetical protein